VVGYVIAVVAFALPFVFARTGLARPRLLLGVGAVLAIGWVVALAAGRAEDERGHQIIPLWFLAGLVALLYLIWCGGLWLGVRLRRARTLGSGA
jgi:hypothetical protein